jgi:hypothetical protein
MIPQSTINACIKAWYGSIESTDYGKMQAVLLAYESMRPAPPTAPEGMVVQGALLAALRNLPDEHEMIEHNPDEGMRLFCCGGTIEHVWGGNDLLRHKTTCWFMALKQALAVQENT